MNSVGMVYTVELVARGIWQSALSSQAFGAAPSCDEYIAHSVM